MLKTASCGNRIMPLPLCNKKGSKNAAFEYWSDKPEYRGRLWSVFTVYFARPLSITRTVSPAMKSRPATLPVIVSTTCSPA